MGGDTTTQSPLRGDVRDEGRTPEEVAGDGVKGKKGKKGIEGCDKNSKDVDEVEQGDNGGSVRDGAYGGR